MIVLRDYSQDLDALLIAKPRSFAAEMTAMYQDFVCRPLMQTPGSKDMADESTAVDEAENIKSTLLL